MKNKLIIVTAFILFAVSGWSQKTEVLKDIEVSTTKAVFLGKVSLEENKKMTATDRRTKLKGKKLKMQPPNFQGRGKSHVVIPKLEHQGNDPLRQSQFSKRAIDEVEILVNVDGLFNDFGSPHDPTGAIGKDYYVQAINATTIGVFGKEGSLVSQFTGNTLWTPLGETSLGDPIVLFDHENNQWIITEFADPANLLIAVSETSDPLGDYFVYSFSTPTFPDYPKYSIWGDFVVVTTNESGPGFLHQYFIDRDALLNGFENVTIQRVQINGNSSTEAGFYVTSPAHWNGAMAPSDDSPLALKINDSSWGEVDEDVIEIFSFDIDLENADNTEVSKLSLPVTPFDSYPCDTETGGFACLAQGGSSSGLDAIPEVIMNVPNYRNFGTHESIVFNFITDVTDGDNLSGIRWVELRKTDGAEWALYQEGTFAPDDGLHRYMGSIAIDISGNIGLAYTVSSSSEFAGIRFTGRYSDDELGQMTVTETELVAGTNSISTDRFGDYPHMTVDPVDGLSFWFTSEYAGNGSDNSKTRIAAFRLERKEHDLAVSDILSPVSSGLLGALESVEVEIENIGGSAESDFDLTLTVDEAVIEVFTYSETLEAGATAAHTFATTADFSQIGAYNVKVSLELDTDENEENNSREEKVNRLAEIDLGISLNADEEVCGTSSLAKAIITNYGGTTITTAEIELFRGTTSIEVVSFSGSLETNSSEELDIVFSDLADGINDVSVVINSVNGAADEVGDNDESEASINVDTSLEQINFTLNPDEYPNETTWVLADSEGNELLSGGPYEGEATILETFCVPSDNCYIFSIFDSESDGICCAFGEGSYSLTNAAGTILFESNGEFTNSEVSLVCLGDGNFPSVDVSLEMEMDNSSICSDVASASVLIINKGSEDITSLDLVLHVNDVAQETVEFSGSISFGESQRVNVTFADLALGSNEVKVIANNPNNTTDENMEDNEAQEMVSVTDKESVIFSFIPDEYSSETTWEITNSTNEIIYSGGPYAVPEGVETLESICLDLDGCYSFTIFDSGGDGICCGFGDGSYSLISPSGSIIFSGDGGFGSSETTDFCLGAECNLAVDVSVTEIASGQNGAIVLQAAGSYGYSYSIDGGDTFGENPVFDNLAEGTYEIVVTSQDGACQFTQSVTLETVLAVDVEAKETVLSPNPTDGLFQISVAGHEYIDGFLEVQVLDINGRVIQERKISRYNDTFMGTISLYAFPNGVYFVKLKNAETTNLSRIIKR